MASDLLNHPDILDAILGTDNNLSFKSELDILKPEDFVLNPKDPGLIEGAEFCDEFWKSFLNLSETNVENSFSASSPESLEQDGYSPKSHASSDEQINTGMFSSDISNGSLKSKKYNEALADSLLVNQVDSNLEVNLIQVGAQEVVITSEDALKEALPIEDLSSDNDDGSMDDVSF